MPRVRKFISDMTEEELQEYMEERRKENEKRQARQDAINEQWGKITKDNIDDYLDWVVEDIYKDQDEAALEYARREPDPLSYHLGAGVSIRNIYIHNRDFSEYGETPPEPDDLSHVILTRFMYKLLGEEFELIWHMYPFLISHEFVDLRRGYKKAYGEFPVEIEKKYVEKSGDQSMFQCDGLEEELLDELREAISLKGDVEELCKFEVPERDEEDDSVEYIRYEPPKLKKEKGFVGLMSKYEAMCCREAVRLRFWGKNKKSEEQRALSLMRGNGLGDGYCEGPGWIYFKDPDVMIKSVEILDEAGIKYTMGKRFHCDRELECKKEYRAESFDWENAGKEEKENHLIKTCGLDDLVYPVNDLWRISYDDPATKEKAAAILRENGFQIVLEDEEDIVLNDVAPPCNFEISDFWQGYELLKNMGCCGRPCQFWLIDAIRMIEDDGMKKGFDKEKTGIDYWEKLLEKAKGMETKEGE